MSACKKCSNPIPTRILVGERERNIGRRRFCLECRPYKKGYIQKSKNNKYKIACVEYKGGKCQFCGYNKSLKALAFHHRNPAEKKFEISASYCRSWEEIKRELDKCVLLCGNCHCEVHDELIECPQEIIKNENVVWPRPTIKENAEKQRIYIPKEVLLQDKTTEELSRELGVSARTVKKNREENNIRVKFTPQSKIPPKEILEKLVWEKPIIDIAKDYEVSATTVRKWCWKLDIEWPPHGYWCKKETRVRIPKTPSNTLETIPQPAIIQ